MEKLNTKTEKENEVEFKILDDRLKKLENKIRGFKGTELSSVNITDILSKSMTVTSTAISNREKMAMIVKRLNVWDRILDIIFEEAHLGGPEKIEQVNEDLKEIVNDFKKIKTVLHVFNFQEIIRIPETVDRFLKLSDGTFSNEEKVKLMKMNLSHLIKRCGNVCDDVSKAFTMISSVVTELETISKPTKN